MFQISQIHFSVFLEIQHILAPDSFFIYYDSKGGIIWHFFNKHGQILLARVLNDKKVKKMIYPLSFKYNYRITFL